METNKRWMLMKLGLAITLMTPLSLWAQDAKPAAAEPAADPTLVLKAIPADATAFIALRSVRELDQDVQTTWKNLKLPENVVPSIVDLIRAGIKAGPSFNANGSIAVVVTNLSEVKTAEEIESHLAILFPTTDGEAMSKAMGGEKDGEIIKLELNNKPHVAAVKAGFLVLTKDEAGLKAVMKDKTGVIKSLSAEHQKTFGRNDVYGFVNLRGISKELRQVVRQKLEEMASAGGMAQMMSLQKDTFDQLDKFFEEGEELSFGLALDPQKGIMLNFAVAMKPDSELGKQMAAVKGASGSMLVGLPNEPTILAVGMVGNPNSEKQVRKMFDALLSSEGIGDKVDKAKLTEIRDLVAKCAASMQQLSVGISGLPAEGGEGMIGVTVVGTVKNSQEFKDSVKGLYTAGKDLIVDAAKKSGESEEDVKKIADAVAWKENAEKVGDANVDQLTFDLSKIPDAEADTLDQVKKVLGKEGVLVRVASVGPTHVVVTFGGGAKRFETIAGLVTKGESPLSENAGIKKVADRIPAGPKLAEGYVGIDQLLETVMNIATEVGSPSPFPLAMRNAAPIAFTSTKLGEAGQQGELLIPIELLRSAADMARPLLGMIMGGQPPAAPATEEGKLN